MSDRHVVCSGSLMHTTRSGVRHFVRRHQYAVLRCVFKQQIEWPPEAGMSYGQLCQASRHCAPPVVAFAASVCQCKPERTGSPGGRIQSSSNKVVQTTMSIALWSGV